jgi:arogenate/prephenate dehydratase
MTTAIRPSVAIQGEAGSFSHQAALDVLGEDIALLPRTSFDAVFDAVADGVAGRGVVPIENSLTGSIHENYDRLSERGLHIVGETQLRVRHCLIGLPGVGMDEIRRAASHPVALAQCRRFFVQHPSIEAVAAYDTAGSVIEMLRLGTRSQAAVASRLAATMHGGAVLAEGIEDDPQNFTRFLLVARDPGPLALATKTSIVFRLDNIPGALFKALEVFARRGVDLSKIESRPLRGRPWEYAFYLDVLGDPRGPAGEAVAELQRVAADLRVLGSYPEGLRGRPTETPTH